MKKFRGFLLFFPMWVCFEGMAQVGWDQGSDSGILYTQHEGEKNNCCQRWYIGFRCFGCVCPVSSKILYLVYLVQWRRVL